MDIQLVNVAASLKRFGQPFGTIPTIPRQCARLEWVPPRSDMSDSCLNEYGDWTQPQVAGVPPWTQQPQRVFCKACRHEMTFVAAMATASEFAPVVPINNESGFQYHFACDACQTISVLAQWT